MNDRQLRLSRALRLAVDAARSAGRIMMREAGRIRPEDASRKGPRDFVTEIDRECERLIRRRIHKGFPSDAILSEEKGGKMPHAEYLWLVDPLDGTVNYMHRFPLFCVSIAMAVNQKIEIGVVYDPVHDELFSCKRNEGARLNDEPIAVSGCRDMARAYVATGFPSRFKDEADRYVKGFRKVLTSVAGLRRAGSAALDLAYVACGRFDGFWEPRLFPWDMAAGVLLIETAGGIVTNESGKPWTLSSRGVITGNRRVHGHLTRLLKG
jgi:myo-inositol-1(or 4)-monophosphatase